MAREALSMDNLADMELDQTFMDWWNSDEDHSKKIGELRITTFLPSSEYPGMTANM
jgi:hypothetical protein